LALYHARLVPKERREKLVAALNAGERSEFIRPKPDTFAYDESGEIFAQAGKVEYTDFASVVRVVRLQQPVAILSGSRRCASRAMGSSRTGCRR
jgi:hypothetical protein